jgi:hypothetical protein
MQLLCHWSKKTQNEFFSSTTSRVKRAVVFSDSQRLEKKLRTGERYRYYERKNLLFFLKKRPGVFQGMV